MWPSSIWKSSLSGAKVKEETNISSISTFNKDSTLENGNSNREQPSLLTSKGSTSEPGMMSVLSSTQNSASMLNPASFVASTPATTNNLPHDHDVTNLSESTSYVPFCPHNDLQSSTQIEDIQSEKDKSNDSCDQIRRGYRNSSEINSLCDTPSRFQVPSSEKSIFPLDISKHQFSKGSSVERKPFIVGENTPKLANRGRLSDSSGSGGNSKTPKGSRVNPFESHLSMHTLHLPTFSPSVFSTVLSPSQESSNRFWSIDQQSILFPAKISEDSPWKQETASSRLDADTENSTQEAIDMYFSYHHKITSPEDLPRTNVQNDRGSLINQTNASHMTVEDLGGSPELRGKSLEEKESTQAPYLQESSPRQHENMSTEEINSEADVVKEEAEKNKVIECSRGTQTDYTHYLTLPPILPMEVEEILLRYNLLPHDHSLQASNQCTSSPLAQKQQVMPRSYSRIASIVSNTSGGDDSYNLSNSTLRRKLFEGVLDDECDQPDINEAGNNSLITNTKDKEKVKREGKELHPGNVDDAEKMFVPRNILTPNQSSLDPRNNIFSSAGKENREPAFNVNITPGAIMLTPKANSVGPTPDKSLTWSLSPVSRNKKPRELVGSPIESSTPTKS